MIVALARKLFVALWRDVADGVVPDGAERGRWLAVAAET
jgi:hypothetical protein